MYTIGLTGSIGAGKSTAAHYLKNCGYPVVDADQLGHETYLPNTEGFRRVVGVFGPDIVDKDGYIDRKSLANIVFADTEQLHCLNAIVWPEIKRLAISRLEQTRRTKRYPIILFEAAVLIEANWDTLVDEIWSILAAATNVVQRVMIRDRSSKVQLKQRMDVQISDEERIQRSNVIINNNGTIDDLYSAVDQELIDLQQRIRGDS